MILALLAAALQTAAVNAANPPVDLPAPVTDAKSCSALVDRAPDAAIAAARRWAAGDGGLPAQQCLGQAYAAAGQFGPAADVFESAAHHAEIDGTGLGAAAFWAQAGNAALAGGDAARARTLLGHAIERPESKGELKGEVLLDRARADVQAGDPAAARSDLDAALTLVPADPMAWLLSATLARRMNDGTRAAADIAQAAVLAPKEAAVAFEAGNIAQLAGDTAKARESWARAAAADPDSDAGQAAVTALKQLAPQ